MVAEAERSKEGKREEVDQSSLLNELVFFINSFVFNLLLSVGQMFALSLFNEVSPHVAHLLHLVVGVDVVEHTELWTNQVSEVTELSISEVQGDQVLVMPDH